MRSAERVRGEGAEPIFSVVGRKGVSAMTFRKQDLVGEYVGFTDRPSFSDARQIGEEMVARYVDEEVDRVELIYNRFVSPLTQHVWRQTLLPLQQAEVVGEGADAEAEPEDADADQAQGRSEWFYEPDPEELLTRLIPEYVTISVYRALLESAASELGARMTAMRNAAENAEKINDKLTLEMNRARQAEITQQILEVVSGAEALS
jgi:F-type H+-transporting ATPase subunit gamma